MRKVVAARLPNSPRATTNGTFLRERFPYDGCPPLPLIESETRDSYLTMASLRVSDTKPTVTRQKYTPFGSLRP